jgi:hypothetical protein
MRELNFNVALSPKELSLIVKTINDLFLLRHGNQALEFSGFVQFIIQSAIYSASKVGPVSDYSELVERVFVGFTEKLGSMF